MEVDGSSYFTRRDGWGAFSSNWECLGGLPKKHFEISGSEKCILVDPGDGFAIDNGGSKNPSGPIGESGVNSSFIYLDRTGTMMTR